MAIAAARQSNAAEAECQDLVRLLLTAVEHPRIYVLVVMRSDYLGNCVQFPDLPERMSQSLYLVPRLSRDQLQEAVALPARGEIEPALVQRLLAEITSDADQLPRVQHLLKRMWETSPGHSLTLEAYTQLGGWSDALSNDLDRIYAVIVKQ